jgi:hypothetical protein
MSQLQPAILLFTMRRMDASGAGRRMIANLVADAGGAAPAATGLLATIRAHLWPPTRANAATLAALFAVASVIIGITLRPRGGTHKADLMAKKKAKVLEVLDKLLEDARKARPPSKEAKAAIAQLEGSLDALGKLRAEKVKFTGVPKR